MIAGTKRRNPRHVFLQLERAAPPVEENRCCDAQEQYDCAGHYRYPSPGCAMWYEIESNCSDQWQKYQDREHDTLYLLFFLNA